MIAASHDTNRFQTVFQLLQLGTIAVFWGRAFQHLYWDAPFRALLWDEEWMSGPVQSLLGMDWQTYITHPDIDQSINQLIMGFGLLYLLCGLVALLLHRLPSFCSHFLLLGSLGLVFLSLLYCKEKFFSVGQFFEYSLQFTTPVFLWLLHRQQKLSPSLMRWMAWAIALTFTCHGLYAVNFYPRPGLFVGMIINILPVSEDTAIHFLNAAGALDFILSAALLLLPRHRWSPFLLYASLWGLLTALARVWAHFHFEFASEALLAWTHEMIFRFPHFLVPLALWYYLPAWPAQVSKWRLKSTKLTT
ncbi:MAG: hypothetical protein AAFV25_23680 [Bacteroidota bacterium]